MADSRTYPTGVPCWVDTEQPDQQAAGQFYGSLFGWTFHDAMPPDAPGSYLIAQLDGLDVGAIGASSGTTAKWNTYIAVDSADAMAEVVVGAGGQVISPPQDAGPGGRGATLIDSHGAEFRIWQAKRRLGAQIVNVPGAWNFSDLHTNYVDGAKEFYSQVFGWQADDLGFATMWRRPGYGAFLSATVDPDIHVRQSDVSAPPGFDDAIAWLAPAADGEATHWHVTFAVADRDDAVATALGLGATDLSGPVDTDWTKAAVVSDPQGATFTLSQFSPPQH
jgi:predicted enzyme related to lactoylglutathione lyase